MKKQYDVTLDDLYPPASADSRPIGAVLDTDTYNEVDDQFALAYALLSPRIDLQAVLAAPFHNHRSSGPADGMERSYQEIIRICTLLGQPAEGLVWRGSTAYLAAPDEPIESPAARRLIELSLMSPVKLQVLTIGCATNIASALLLDPTLASRIVVVWLGGHPRIWPHTNEFNLMQDVYAAQVLFDSGVPLVRFPCAQVTELMATTIPELEACLAGRSELGDYLVETVRGYAPQDERCFAWSKVIWDVVTVAWLDCPETVSTHLVSTPRLVGDHTTPKQALCFNIDDSRPLCREAVSIRRDAIFRRLFGLINAGSNSRS
jgi:hypothetical protein